MSLSSKTNPLFEQYRNYKVLIIDDDKSICTILERCISETGLQVESETHPEVFFDKLNQAEFDVILSDIYMPIISGIEVLKLAADTHPFTPVIMMTGKPSLEISVEALREGAFDFLMKPFTVETVLLTLERALKYRTVLLENEKYKHHLEQLVEERTKEVQSFLLQSVKSLTHALEAKDPYTQGHGYNVSQLVIELAKKLNVNENDYMDLKLAAQLHDIGKIGIPDAVLMKPGKLTDEEYDLMKEHVTIGYKILSPIPSLKNVSRYVHEHHERMDGKGYPRGLTGKDIHYNSQLLVVAEVCDALAAKRCYKPPWSTEQIVGYFSEHKGSAFHPEVTEALIQTLHERGDEILNILRGNNGV